MELQHTGNPDRARVLRLLARALAAAPSVEMPLVREAFRQAILQAQVQAGDRDAALRTARQISTVQNGFFRRQALGTVALARAQAGDLAGARTLLAPYQSRTNRDGWERRIAIALAQGGDLAAAFATIARLPRWTTPLEGLPLFARGTPRNVPAALATAQTMPTPGARAWTQTVVALTQARAGKREAARQILKGAQKDAEDASVADALVPPFPARMGVAIALARAGDLTGALDVSRRSDPPSPVPIPYVLGLLEIARAQIDAGDRDSARQTLLPLYAPVFEIMTAPTAGPQSGRQEQMAHLAMRLLLTLHAQSGDLEGVRREAQRWPVEMTLLPIALGQANAGDFDGALKTRARLPEPDGYDVGPVPFLIGIAQAQLRAGRRIDAQKTLTAAAKGIHLTPNSYSYEEEAFPAIMALIAECLVDAGDVAGARRLGQRIVEGWHRTALWRIAARAQARRGQDGDALAWANTLPTVFQKASALLGVAEGVLARLDPTGPYQRTPVVIRGLFDWIEAEYLFLSDAPDIPG